MTATIINLTPHAVTIGDLTIAPTSPPARVGESVRSAAPLSTQGGAEIPTSWVTYARLDDLPDPAPDTYYVVSLVVAQAAAACGRSTDDLLTPGQQVRDAQGRVVGCQSLARVGSGVRTFRWRDDIAAFTAECLAQGGAGDVSATVDTVHLGRYARQTAREERGPTDRVTFFCCTRKGRGVRLTGVPFGTPEQRDAAYAALSAAGATPNDVTAAERETATAALSPATA